MYEAWVPSRCRVAGETVYVEEAAKPPPVVLRGVVARVSERIGDRQGSTARSPTSTLTPLPQRVERRQGVVRRVEAPVQVDRARRTVEGHLVERVEDVPPGPCPRRRRADRAGDPPEVGSSAYASATVSTGTSTSMSPAPRPAGSPVVCTASADPLIASHRMPAPEGARSRASSSTGQAASVHVTVRPSRCRRAPVAEDQGPRPGEGGRRLAAADRASGSPRPRRRDRETGGSDACPRRVPAATSRARVRGCSTFSHRWALRRPGSIRSEPINRRGSSSHVTVLPPSRCAPTSLRSDRNSDQAQRSLSHQTAEGEHRRSHEATHRKTPRRPSLESLNLARRRDGIDIGISIGIGVQSLNQGLLRHSSRSHPSSSSRFPDVFRYAQVSSFLWVHLVTCSAHLRLLIILRAVSVVVSPSSSVER